MTEKTRHWKYFQNVVVKNKNKQETILFGGLTMNHNLLIKSALDTLGYKTEALPTPSTYDFQTGKEYGNYGQCNPTYFTVGSLVNYLKSLEEKGLSKKDIIENYSFFTFSSPCGPCRFGMYQNEFRLALSNSGFEGFRVFTYEQTQGLNQKDNLSIKINLRFLINILYAANIGDIINEVGYYIRPYEIKKGETDKVMKESVSYIRNTLLNLSSSKTTGNKNMIIDSAITIKQIILSDLKEITKALEHVGEMFDQIEMDRTIVKPKVKIIGEFWAQTIEGDGNFDMFRFLEKEGAEVMVEPVATWTNYLIHQGKLHIEDRKGLKNKELNDPDFSEKFNSWIKYNKNKIILEIANKVFNSLYNKFVKALLDIPHKQLDQKELAEIAHDYYHSRASGGEGHLEVAKNIYYHKNGLCHMVLSLKPFGCLPSTQSDGVQAAVTGKFKRMIYLPIETSGEGAVNAHSRVQMALGETKQRTKEEFKIALNRTGLTIEEVKNFIDKNPQLKKPSYKIPQHKKTVGMAANTVYHIKSLMDEK